MNINLLKTFLEVARLRHFGKAADRVCLTQSAVSARIKQLEQSLGVPLFERNRNNIQLTQAGRRLARSADQIIKQWEQAQAELGLGNDEEQQLIRIGTIPDLWGVVAIHWLLAVRNTLPLLMLQVQTLNGQLLNERLLSDELDIAILFDPPFHTGIERIELEQMELVLVATEACDIDRADHLPYIHVDWGGNLLHQQDPVAERLQRVLSVNQGSMALDYLLQQQGAAYLPLQMVEEALQQQQLFLVEQAPRFQKMLCFAFNRTHPNRTLIDQLIRFH